MRKRGPAPKWQQQLEAIDQLPKSQQKFVAQMLDALIAQATTKASSEGREILQEVKRLRLDPEKSKNACRTIMNNKQLNETSKFLSYILRHEPHTIGLQLDAEGWADINSLITGAAKEGRVLDQAIIQTVVNSSDKKRFTLSDDGQRIRAAQGHSAPDVNLQYIEKEPPEFLYHGTATRFLESILQQGLIAVSRHHVHLSQETLTAIAVGQRYGKPVVLKIESLRMYQQGFKFFQAENSVWLTEAVPVNFISKQNQLPDSSLDKNTSTAST